MRNFLAIDIFSSNNSCFLSAAAFCRALSLSALALWRAFFLSAFSFFMASCTAFCFSSSKSLPTFVISIHLFILSESSLRITLSVNTISPDNKNLCISGESIFFAISKHLTIQSCISSFVLCTSGRMINCICSSSDRISPEWIFLWKRVSISCASRSERNTSSTVNCRHPMSTSALVVPLRMLPV